MAVVYLHKNPETEEVFYVGMSTKDDLKRPHNFSNRNSDWHDYVEKNGKPLVEILEKGIGIKEAYKLEIELIKKFGRKIYGMGSLVNFTKGGEPVNEMRGINNGMFGKKHSKESKRKISLKHIGFKHSDESKYKMSKSRKGSKNSTSRKVLDKNTNKEYGCLKECFHLYGYSYSYTKGMLNGSYKNKTGLIYISEKKHVLRKK